MWWFYADLKAYCRDPTPRRKRELQARFDRLFTTTGFATLDRLLARLHANKIELLRALERPDIPLHTNGSENDIRCQVTRRKISGGTRSETGRDCRDALPRLDEDLRQARRLVLGLPRQPARHPRRATHPPPARPHPPARRRLTARPFAPVTPIGAQPTRRTTLADAGYCNEPDLLELENRGIDAHVALGREGKSRVAVDPARLPATHRMGEKLASLAGKAQYAQRKWLSEAPNGWIKEVLGFR